MIRFGSTLQTNWDWRAAGNFMFGGTGSALLVVIALAGHPPPVLPITATALVLVGLGLSLVWLEIGRPWRALHVYFHPQTSWMTREGAVAMVIFPLTLAAMWFGNAVLFAVAGVLGALFLYCQGRILQGARGIPAWREPAIVPLIVSTGLAEGTAIVIIFAVSLDALQDWHIIVLAALLLLRGIFWTRYRAALQRNQAPAGAQQKFRAMHALFLWGGNALPLVLILLPFAAKLDWLIPLGAAIAFGAGWHMKFVLVARAAFVQGYGVGALQRGRPVFKKPVRRAGDPWQA